MTDEMKKFILNDTNTRRDQTASGTMGLTGAYRMPIIEWDDELERQVIYKLQDCQYTSHDPCRNTCKIFENKKVLELF